MIPPIMQFRPGGPQVARLLVLVLFIGSAAFARATPTPTPVAPFTAEYVVFKDGARIGATTFSLRAVGGGHWRYSSHTRGTAGLAALFNAEVEEVSSFRWKHGRPELLSHDYSLRATALYSQHRHVEVNWRTGTVRVEDSRKGTFEYPARPGLLDQHLLSLALARHLDEAGAFSLPVTAHDRVQQQRYRVAGTDRVEVPAGDFKTVRVVRVDDDKNLSAWYVPDRYPIPVKLSQDGKDQLTLKLKSYRSK